MTSRNSAARPHTEPSVKGKKGNEEYLYSAILVRTPTLKALRHGSQFYLQTTPCPPFLRKRSPDGATTTEAADIQLQLYYSFMDPKGMKGCELACLVDI